MVTGTNGERHNTTNFSLVRYLLLWRGMRMKYIFISRATKKVVKERHLYSGRDTKSMKKYAIYKIIFLLFHVHPKTSFLYFHFGFGLLIWVILIACYYHTISHANFEALFKYQSRSLIIFYSQRKMIKMGYTNTVFIWLDYQFVLIFFIIWL